MRIVIFQKKKKKKVEDEAVFHEIISFPRAPHWTSVW
jgi:hypothetical protein